MKRTVFGVLVLLFAAASGLKAQDWESPSFMPPRPGSDLGLYVVDGDASNVGFQGIWRQTGPNLGLRLGFLDAPDDYLTLGVETWGNIILEGADFPLDLSWTVGGGARIDGVTTVSVPVGVSIGRTLDLSSESDVSMQLYGHPRLALVFFENPAGDLELDLDGRFDLGADFYFNRNLTLKFGASLGDWDAIGIGVAWRR